MEKKYNTRSPAVKRLMREAAEMASPTSDYFAAPLEENLFEWHFTVRGPEDTEFQGGIYHGRIIVPAEYPMKPPDIIVLTPNGRFEVGKKICLSISGFHPETWQPSWSIRTALLAILGFMPTPGQGSIGSLDYTADERKALARRSVDWGCTECGKVCGLLLPPSQEKNMEQKEEMDKIVQSVAFKSEEEIAKLKKEKAETSKEPKVDTEKKQVPKCETTASGLQNPPTNEVVDGVREPVTQSSQRLVVNDQVQNNVESRGVQVYDVLIMLLVAAIAALLARRINLMQESDTGNNFPGTE